MTRYKAIIAYDGTDFAGFQIQDNGRTVQEELTRVLLRLNSGLAVKVHGSGRTDSGVHALGQVVHFDLPQVRDAEKLRFALDTQTADDIDVLSVDLMSDDFHSRFNTHSKTYQYRVNTSRAKNPLTRRFSYHFPKIIAFDEMKTAAALLVGRHDFSGFTAAGATVTDKVRTITQVDVVRVKDEIHFVFSGNGFLYKQIRNMVGTLLKIGAGKWRAERISEILLAENRDLAGPTAPAHGLCLMEVRYED
ncbi:tRNA pseudouridine synthase A [Lactococcus hodotermopsidis]|uniref:tRNA pseudouridine synthase A n=1 Tax=Pseudolactococcus hodotermopsidis TaxID=2709157 RepID=A0A6A0B8L9_9LACT|nr:tRNA pseudouridine(38-40) synthase TruA [Lactococcus hodotermopsidis]GFH41749.1 tRNA pseudouridine synthase A [Lactococcus hodotermopsidis]